MTPPLTSTAWKFRTLRKTLILALIPVTLMMAVASAAAAQAGPPDAKVEVIPASLEVPAQGAVEALVVIRNPVTDVLRDVRLSWFTDANVSVTVQPAATNDLVPFGTLAWTLRISQEGDEPAAGTIHLRVDYVWRGERGNVPLLAAGSLAVTARKPEPAEQVAQVRAETALTALTQFRPGTVYLIVTNASDVPIRVTRIQSSGPKFVTFTPPDAAAGATLAPREVRTFPIEVEATETVQTGKHLLVFEVGFTWERAGSVWTGNLVATHPVDVGVVGETEILTLLGVPSFLILPGFLMVTTLSLLWRFLAPRKEFPFAIKSQEFWYFAITLSLITAFAYPLITGLLLRVSRNYLEGYGLNDIVWVWLGSIVVTVGFYGIAAALMTARQAYFKWRMRQRTPSASDTPLVLLRKLQLQGLGVQLPRVDVTIDGTLQRAFVLEPLQEGRDSIWVGPGIVVTWSDEDMEEEDIRLQRVVSRLLKPEGSTSELARLLEVGQARGILRVGWRRMGQLSGPYQVKPADIKRDASLEPTVLVEQE